VGNILGFSRVNLWIDGGDNLPEGSLANMWTEDTGIACRLGSDVEGSEDNLQGELVGRTIYTWIAETWKTESDSGVVRPINPGRRPIVGGYSLNERLQ
jgi:hypothetical protein